RGMASPLDYEGDVADLTFSLDERWLAIVRTSGGVDIFDTAKGQLVKSIPMVVEPGAPLESPRFSPDGSLLAVLGSDALHFIRTADWRPLPEQNVKARRGGGDTLSFVFSRATGNLVVAERGLLRRFQVSPWTLLASTEVNPEHRLYFSIDTRWIATIGSGDGSGT